MKIEIVIFHFEQDTVRYTMIVAMHSGGTLKDITK